MYHVDLVLLATCSPALLDLKTVCDELGSVEHKSHKIGVMLGIPHHNLEMFRKDDNPLSAIANFWLCGNVEGAEISWKSIAKALGSSFVGEPALSRARENCDEEKRYVYFGVQSDKNAFLKSLFSAICSLSWVHVYKI